MVCLPINYVHSRHKGCGYMCNNQSMNDTWKSKLLVHSLHFEWFCASASEKLVVSGDFNSRNPEDCRKKFVLVGKTFCSLC